MNIFINYTDGSVTEYWGLADHIDAERHLEQMDFEIFPDAKIPAGDYGNGRLICVRAAWEDYGDDEYEVAEIE